MINLQRSRFRQVENAFNRVGTQKIFNLISSDVIATRFSVRYSSSGYLEIRFPFTSVKERQDAYGEKENNSAAVRAREPSIYQTFNATDFLSRADKFEEYRILVIRIFCV